MLLVKTFSIFYVLFVLRFAYCFAVLNLLLLIVTTTTKAGTTTTGTTTTQVGKWQLEVLELHLPSDFMKRIITQISINECSKLLSSQSIAPYQQYIHIGYCIPRPEVGGVTPTTTTTIFKKLFLVGINYFCKFYLMPNAKKLKQVEKNVPVAECRRGERGEAMAACICRGKTLK